ncbi:MerR family transcriptional regulator [Alkalibaculum sp. M08DMB]|uniref:MerR family transcriptional regulator n=1 Tax=Alkalibaculum sporogenes TaxID=2655001 RepID=A0A6A7K9L4_9FIRM|nr:MerR family transcriptional regulator [Alkalibaculum sporogenes]MPW25877.1 MerR family transcriptional regulator [Alkalibaculum sporogenes]
MDSNKELLSVGELASKCGVTVRTLQYYDTQGLLKPSKYSEGGRRMYSLKDVVCLQQILFLKSLGFSLEEIRDQLLPTDSSEQLIKVFIRQKDIINQQIQHMQLNMKTLEQVIEELSHNQNIDIKRLIAVIGSTQQNNPYTFMVRHMDENQMDYYIEQANGDKKFHEFNELLKELTNELIELYKKKSDPKELRMQSLAKRWWNIILEITNGDQHQIQKIFNVGSNEKLWPEDSVELKEAMNLLGYALNVYFEKQNIDISSYMKE